MVISKKTASALLLSLSVLGLAACAASTNLEDAQYWERKNSTSSLYLRGPKAQQTLHKDIAACVNDINELERLGALREAIPANSDNGRVPDQTTPEGRMANWDSPERDGFLYAEQLDYHDFEGCMDYKGWERVEHLPYEQAKTARGEYLQTVYGQRFQSRYGDAPSIEPPAQPTQKFNQ